MSIIKVSVQNILSNCCLLMLFSVFCASFAYAESMYSGKEELKSGISAYNEGNYNEAIKRLKGAIEKFHRDRDNLEVKIMLSTKLAMDTVFNSEKLWDAHFYLGLSYRGTGQGDKANQEFAKAKAENPRKTPDTKDFSGQILIIYASIPAAGSKVEKPVYQEMRKPVYKKWWFWTIIGSATAAAVALSTSSETGPGPTPPPPPSDETVVVSW